MVALFRELFERPSYNGRFGRSLNQKKVFVDNINNNNNNNNNNNLYLKSLHISTINISSVELLLRLFQEHMYTIYIKLWKCDLLNATTDDALYGDQTRDPSAKSPMRYRLRKSSPED